MYCAILLVVFLGMLCLLKCPKMESVRKILHNKIAMDISLKLFYSVSICSFF